MDHLNITLGILAAAGGAEGKTISEQFGIDSLKLAAQVFTFVLVWFILKWKAYGPILEMLEKLEGPIFSDVRGYLESIRRTPKNKHD